MSQNFYKACKEINQLFLTLFLFFEISSDLNVCTGIRCLGGFKCVCKLPVENIESDNCCHILRKHCVLIN